jgi:hypothetical protein
MVSGNMGEIAGGGCGPSLALARRGGDTARMGTDRILISLGIACLAAVAFGFITGVASVLPVAAVATLIVGVATLAAGLRLGGGERSVPSTDGTRVSIGAAKIGVAALVLMGLGTLVIAGTVAEGEATGHAVGHLAIGIVALGLLSALAFLWRPSRGTQAALIRRMVLVLLGLAVFGSFLESVGGAGYDAANSEPRVEALAALHGVALPIASLGMPGIVLGAVVGIVVLTTSITRRRRAA